MTRVGGWTGQGVWRAGAGTSTASLQVRVGQPEVLLDGLEPGRDYDVWVQSLRGAEASEARGIRARTCECRPLGKCPTLVPPSLPPLQWPQQP